MIKVTKDKIYLTRGDTAFLEIHIEDDTGEEYIPLSTDKVFFRLKKTATAKSILLEKEVDIETMLMRLDENDTKDLQFTTYKYEVELVTESDYHFTAIENADFEIGPELELHNE